MQSALVPRSLDLTPEADLLAQVLCETVTRQPRVLLAVLNPVLRSACRWPLLRGHYTVSEADCALLVAELALSSGPELVILDLHCQDLSGRRLLQRLRGDPGTANLPVVGLACGPAPAEVESDPLTRVLSAPFLDFELLEAVGHAFRLGVQHSHGGVNGAALPA